MTRNQKVANPATGEFMQIKYVEEKGQYIIYLGSALFASLSAAILNWSGSRYFDKFLLNVNPIVVIVIAGILGVIFLSYLTQDGRISIYKQENPRELFIFIVIAGLFAFFAMAIDLKVNFPRDLNVPFPESILFYPSIGFLVEIVFHIVPVALILFSVKLLPLNMNPDKVIWVAIFFAALIEPTFQMLAGFSQDYPLWVYVWIWIHVFIINLMQLVIFKRNGFFVMYFFRVTYYFFWHIVWGHIRLKVLF